MDPLTFVIGTFVVAVVAYIFPAPVSYTCKAPDATWSAEGAQVGKEINNKCPTGMNGPSYVATCNADGSWTYSGCKKNPIDYRLIDGNGNSVASHGEGSFFWWKTIPGINDQQWIFDPNTGLVSLGSKPELCMSSVAPNPTKCDASKASMVWKDDGANLVNGGAKWKYAPWSKTT